jgi:hypothetical protein
MESRGDFADGASEPVYGDDHEVIPFSEVTHALSPGGSVAASATGRGVGENSVGSDARRRDGVVLLIDGLLPGGYPEVCGGGHAHMEPAEVRQFIRCQIDENSDSPVTLGNRTVRPGLF